MRAVVMMVILMSITVVGAVLIVMVVVTVVRGGGWRNHAGMWGCLLYRRVLSDGTPGLFLQLL